MVERWHGVFKFSHEARLAALIFSARTLLLLALDQRHQLIKYKRCQRLQMAEYPLHLTQLLKHLL